jgi:hypothetical protein
MTPSHFEASHDQSVCHIPHFGDSSVTITADWCSNLLLLDGHTVCLRWSNRIQSPWTRGWHTRFNVSQPIFESSYQTLLCLTTSTQHLAVVKAWDFIYLMEWIIERLCYSKLTFYTEQAQHPSLGLEYGCSVCHCHSIQ